MPSNAAPSLPAIAFELGIYAVALFVLIDLWRTRRSQIPLMLAAMVFAGALEVSDIRTTHSYYYARFLVMIGTQPTWFPLAVAVAWGLVLHTGMVATERMVGPTWQRPAVAALLGVLVDLVLDPVVANARVVSYLGEVCDQSYLPHGSAFGLGFWVWCVPGHDSTLIWGIPFANFFAWGVVVLGYTAVALVLREVMQLQDRGVLGSIVFAVVTAVVAFCLVDVGLQLYTPLVMHGVPEWSLLVLVFGPGVWFLLRSGPFRTPEPVRLSMWIFPASAMLYCLGAYLLCGIALRAGVSFFAYVALEALVCGGAYAWVLFGRYPGLIAARPHVTPPREALLADAPANVDPAELLQVAALEDPVLRNYMITQRYHDLSCELARKISGPDANWCTFATWASKTAGESIREQEVPPVVLDILRAEQPLDHLLDALRKVVANDVRVNVPDVFDIARSTLAAVRSQVADGNRKVYAELAPLFAELIACFDAQGVLDEAALSRLLASLRPGPTASGGQELLRQGFSAYREASRAGNEPARAQWMLLANCLVGLHEQTRLQSNIAGAMDAPVDVVTGDLAWSKLLPSALGTELQRLLAPEGALAKRIARAVWQRIATAAAMHISLPNGAQIPLGEDVCVSLGQSFPADVRTLDVPELKSLVARFGGDHPSPGGLGALDWAALDDRMRFIIELFRTTQQQTELLEQPFSRGHQLEIEARFEAAVAPRSPSLRAA